MQNKKGIPGLLLVIFCVFSIQGLSGRNISVGVKESPPLPSNLPTVHGKASVLIFGGNWRIGTGGSLR